MMDRQRDYVSIYQDASGDWRWVRIAPNNERLSGSTEAYDSKTYASEQAHQLNADVDDFRVQGDAAAAD